MTNESLLAITASGTKAGGLIYELIQRGTSQWTKKGTEHDKHPQKINCVKLLPLDLRSKCILGNATVDIQYVPGANTIYVNDYQDENGKPQKGLRSQGYDLGGVDYRRAVEEDIKFINGFLYLSRYGGEENKSLVDFIDHQESNTSAKGYKKNPRRNAMFLFGKVVEEKKATNQLENLEVENRAHNLFTSLRTPKGGDFIYDAHKINAIITILDEMKLGDNENSQKMLIIRPYIMKDPGAFLKLYDDAVNEYKITIGQGIKYEVVAIGEKSATIKIDGIVHPISIPLTKSTADERLEELVFYLISDEAGKITYSQLQGEIEAKKANNNI